MLGVSAGNNNDYMENLEIRDDLEEVITPKQKKDEPEFEMLKQPEINVDDI
jgi:hypothetical protein